MKETFKENILNVDKLVGEIPINAGLVSTLGKRFKRGFYGAE